MVIEASVRVPVIAIDGPTASGKGTVAARVAAELGWHVLDSGALYRLAAWTVLDNNINANDIAAVALAARRMQIRFDDGQIMLAGQDVTELIRQEHVGNLASRLAPAAPLREALLERQRAFRQPPGLVADGRDMGTVVFPDADLKIFLLADVQSRAQRRCQQLRERGLVPDEQAVLADLKERDFRDTDRAVAPLKPADDAHQLDSSRLTVEDTVAAVMSLWHKRLRQS
ncbi:(d)CMP kinase [Orrella daihaiensis]|uniref:Cytidylate kinase n=1 Tax=Orrella daihaiensis TaxID=2782176 RepID=A0ABY4ANC8_9BURK|nr:(d)CMP kinase [Orrella daihaiensis]UOD51669.1 (d)CMP kinase [Orrella daihaiensis]